MFRMGEDMSVHRGEWRVHASAVDNIRVIEDSLAWLCGDGVIISTREEKSVSYTHLTLPTIYSV